MKRVKLAILVALAAFALASCDYMLEVLFPEFSSDDPGNFGQKTIQITVHVGNGGTGYRVGSDATVAPIRVVAVQWSFDQSGMPTILKDGEGDLDQVIQHAVVAPDEIQTGSSSASAPVTFNLKVSNGNYAVLIFEDEDRNLVPSAGEATAVAQWEPPPSFMYGPEEFDFFFMEQLNPDFNTMKALDVHLVHYGHPVFNLTDVCIGAVECGNFSDLF